MAVDRETRFHGFASVVQDTFTLIRDVFVGVLIILLLVVPHQLNQWLANRGLTFGGLGPLQLASKDQTQTAGQQVSQAKFEIQDVTGALETIARNPSSPSAGKTIEELVARLKASQTAIDAADTTLKTSLQQQQQALERADPAIKEKAEGWMLLGHVDEAKRNWTSVNAKTLEGRDPSFSGPQRLRITDATYLRADSPAGQHFTASVLGLLAEGEIVNVVEIESSSHALRGGWFVWAKIKRA